MSAVTLTNLDPYFFNRELPQKKMWEKVYEEVTNHTQRKEKNSLIETQRPNETKALKAYRAANDRRLTKAPIVEAYQMFYRIFTDSGLAMDTVSGKLGDWLEKKPFFYLGQKVDIWKFWFDCVIPQGVEDPNAVMVVKPYNRMNPFTPPWLPFAEGGKEKNKPIDISVELIPSADIVFMPSPMLQVLAWKGGFWKVKHKDKEVDKPYFWLLDEEWYYRYMPIRITDKGETIYELEAWYNHDTGLENQNQVPFSTVGGLLTNSKYGKYQESIIESAIEYFNEFKARHSDFQVIMNRFAHPEKLVNAPSKCNTCQGKAQVPTLVNGVRGSQICGDCGGTGHAKDSGPSGTWFRTQNGLEGSNNRPLIEFASSDTNILKINHDIIFSYHSKGSEKIGVGLLVDTSESGKAKEIRLQPSKDFLNSVSIGFFRDLMADVLFFTECLLEVDRSKRQQPTINIPVTYNLENYEQLTERAKSSFPSNRQALEMKAIEKEYKGEPEMIHLYKLAYAYSPLLILNEEELSSRILEMGTYENKEVVKRDNVIRALIQLKAERKGNLSEMSEKEVFTYLDDYIKPYVFEKVEIFDEDGEQVETQESGLITTVGGAQAIVTVNKSVAMGEMSEAAAEEFLTLAFKISPQQAGRLIDQGKAKDLGVKAENE